VDADSRLTPCSHYPSAELLGAVANNPKEQRARRRVLAQHPNKSAGYAVFARAYLQALQNGESLDAIAAESPHFDLISPTHVAEIPVHRNGHSSQSTPLRRS
jgi:hypothetical protein